MPIMYVHKWKFELHSNFSNGLSNSALHVRMMRQENLIIASQSNASSILRAQFFYTPANLHRNSLRQGEWVIFLWLLKRRTETMCRINASCDTHKANTRRKAHSYYLLRPLRSIIRIYIVCFMIIMSATSREREAERRSSLFAPCSAHLIKRIYQNICACTHLISLRSGYVTNAGTY
jgi:hypothetical protein